MNGEWSQIRLKHVARNVVDPENSADADKPFIGLEAISSWTGAIDVRDEDSNCELGNRFQRGDVLFGKLRPYLAKVAAPDFDGHCSGEALVVRPKRNLCSSFLFYLMANPEFVNAVDASTYGAKMPRASWHFIGNMTFSLPDLPTQKTIADFLDLETARIELLIEKKRQLVARLAEREKALLHLMFSQIKAKRWRTRHLGNLRNGAGFPVELQGNPNEDIAFFKVKHLKTFGLDAAITATEDTVSAETARKLRATVFPVGTIVFAKIGAALLLGRFSMIGRPACLDNNMAAFVPNKRMIDADFCLLALSQIDMATMVQPGAVPSLSTEAFYSYELPLPSLEEQQELVSRFRSERATLSSIADATKTSIERLREFRAALITAAVTGQINPETWSRRGTTDRRLDQIEAEMGA
uniref:restriction endonuclease subunit S n=1 Tax=Paracoccus sp. TRP TaxID=412597 RepID=UPI000225F64F|nr:restriction endonuclease subunit S [Paracoccus sp. TRP]